MNWYAKRINKHLLINNYWYFKEFSFGFTIGTTDENFTISFDLLFIGITIIF